MLTIQDIRNHIANNRPTELHLAVYVEGVKRDEAHTGEFTSWEGYPYTNKTGDVLRIAEGQVDIANLMGNRVRFELIDA